ncbi:hypothetical protein GIV98_27130 [Pseudomonas syringae]|nr:hypothetical protein [Pseudomonas syringae]
MLSQYQYDEQGRLQAHSVSQQDRHLFHRHYAYDANGNLAGVNDSRKGNRSYHYDPLDRLINVRGTTPESFAHDPAGNLLGQGDQPAANLANVKGNRLLMQGDRHYDYDAYGNQIRERRGTGQKLVTEYRYDCQHRLIGVSLPGGSVVSYKYDAFGRRIEKTVDGHTTEFLWQGERLIAESADNRYRTYIYEPGTFRPLAMLDGEGPLKATPFYYQLDHLGTPQELTDYSGEIMWSAKYRAYGNLATLDIAEIDNPLRFQGQYFDAETGLHYNRHRYYNPCTGRFLTPDPIKLAGGLNNYQYVPNPTGWVDPLGLDNCPGADGCKPLSRPESPETGAKVNEGAPDAPGPESGKNPKFFKTESTWKASGKGTGNEYKVFQQDIDWNLEHKGMSNLDRAKEGGAPYIMKDGVPQQLQLHHSRQNGKGPLFELSRKTHLTTLKGKGREAVHPYGHNQHPDAPVDRELFKKEVPQYWKDRAAEAAK